MHGNVVEWVLDQYRPDFYATLTVNPQSGTAANPFNKAVTQYPRVVRGGSWDDEAERLRSACRQGSRDVWKIMDPQLPKSRWFHTSAQFPGFRIVRPVKVPSLEEIHDFWNGGVVVEK